MKRTSALLLLAAVVLSPLGQAGSAEDRGLEIAREADRRTNEGFGDVSVEAVMTLRDQRGRESTRKLKIRVLDGETAGDKTLTVFNEPLDVKGTALLTWAQKQGPDDRWIYLPALKRVKRISSENQSGPFMGSEFAYEDFAAQEVEKYTYRFLGEGELNGEPIFINERYPTDEDSGYSKQVMYIDQVHYRTHKIEYYDRRGDLLKVFTAAGFELYDDRYWRSRQMVMTNATNGKTTTLQWTVYQFGRGLDNNDFTQASLRRAR